MSNGTSSATYSYLANSPLVGQITFAQGGTTRMTTTKLYDNLNRLTSIQSGTGVSPVNSFSYANNLANQRTSVTNADNSYWVYQYDNLGQATSGKKYWADGTPVSGQQFTYNFDDIGNRKTTASGGGSGGNNLRSATYTNNALNQILGRTVPGFMTVIGSANSNATVTVNLQRSSRSGNYFSDELPVTNTSAAIWQSTTNIAVLNNGTNADIITTNQGNGLITKTPEIFVYDADGNLTSDGRFTYAWDDENRLTNVTSQSGIPTAAKLKLDMVYDYTGRRIQKIVSTNNGSSYVAQYTNKCVYDGWNLIAELGPSGSLIRSYVWGNDLSASTQGAGGVGGLLAMSYYGASTTNCFVAYDGNGNVAGLVNATDGITIAQYEYGPFGETLRANGAMAKNNLLRYSTKFQDETDLLYYGYRYYSSGMGRWLSRDPIEEEGGANVYSFIVNESIELFDPLGLRGLVLEPPVMTRPIAPVPQPAPQPTPGPTQNPGSGAPQIGVTPAWPNTVVLPFLAPYGVPENQAQMARDQWHQLTGEDYADYAPASLPGHDPSKEPEARKLLAVTGVQDKTKLQCACKKLGPNENGWVFYFPLNNGRATAVVGEINKNFANRYANLDAPVTPKDFNLPQNAVGDDAQRGHLFRKKLGGSGKTRRNIVPMTRTLNQSTFLTQFENPMLNAIRDAGDTVCFVIWPNYSGNTGVPSSVSFFYKTSSGKDPVAGTLPNTQ